MKAVIFARVSSKEQEEGHSIDAQTAKLQGYCERKGYNIAKLYQVTESSNIGERKQFYAMLDFVRETHKATKSRVVLAVDKVDRLMRNFKDYPAVQELVEKEIAEIHIVGENDVISKESNSTQKMFFNFRIMMAQSYTDATRDNVQRSNAHKIKNGEYPNRAPIGYINIRDESGRSDIILDNERCLLVKRIFQEYSTGTYSIGDLLVMSKEWGLRNKTKTQSFLNKSHLHKVLHDKFYIGIMSIKGIEYPHKYPKLLDNATFYKCQEVIAKANKQSFKYSEKPMLFRGMINCAKCGCGYSGYEKRGHVYLRPNKKQETCDCRPINEKQVLKVVHQVLQSLHTPPALLEQMKEHLKSMCSGKSEYQASEFDTLVKEIKEIERKKENLLDMMLSGSVQSITQSMYDKKMQELLQRQHEITHYLESQTKADEVFYITVKSMLELCSKAYEIFESSSMDKKRKLMSFLLSNITINSSSVCYSLKEPFNSLTNIAENSKWWAVEDSNFRPLRCQRSALTN
jgi:site-specific DNA recombinase